VREKLLGSDLTPAAVPALAVGVEDAEQNLREKLAAFFRQIPAVAQPVMEFPQAPSNPPAPFPPFPSAGEGRGEGGAPIVAPRNFEPIRRELPPHPDSLPQGENEFVGSASADRLPAPETSNRSAKADPTSLAGGTPPLQAIQLHNSYLVAQSDDGLVIIDQHALHERIMYEELFARVSRGALESQRLLIPMTLPVSSSQMALLEHVQPLLARLGVEVSGFGPGTVAIHSFPSFLERIDPVEFVRELLERGEQELLDLHEEELLHGVLDMMACKAAVKAGDPLSPGEIEALLARRELVERSSNCPHGRPTTLRLTLRDLEKQFKRTGF